MSNFDILKGRKPDHYKDIDERWEWILTFMVLEDKFCHEMLMLMSKIPSKSIGTMGVGVQGTRLVLVYNPEFVNSLTDPELRYVVTHEIYHVALHHCTVRLPECSEDKEIYNVGADLAINCLIPEDANRHMPKMKKKDADAAIAAGNKDVKTGQNVGLLPKDMGFPDKLSMEQYIQLLREKGFKGGQNGDGEGKTPGFDEHGGWKESDAVKEIIRGKIEQISRNEKVWGSIPGDVKAMILAAQKATISWRKYLRHFLGLLASSRRTSTFKRPNRRFGYPYSGTKSLSVDRKLVAIDTSGSIGDADLAQFLAEVNRLAEIQPVDLQLFDHELQGKIQPFAKKVSKFNFAGRGGTAFTPVFKLADERHYESIIILTDGCAEEPPKPRYVKDVLWCIIGEGNHPPVKWGTVVHIVPKGVAQPPRD